MRPVLHLDCGKDLLAQPDPHGWAPPVLLLLLLRRAAV